MSVFGLTFVNYTLVIQGSYIKIGDTILGRGGIHGG